MSSSRRHYFCLPASKAYTHCFANRPVLYFHTQKLWAKLFSYHCLPGCLFCLFLTLLIIFKSLEWSRIISSPFSIYLLNKTWILAEPFPLTFAPSQQISNFNSICNLTFPLLEGNCLGYCCCCFVLSTWHKLSETWELQPRNCIHSICLCARLWEHFLDWWLMKDIWDLCGWCHLWTDGPWVCK